MRYDVLVDDEERDSLIFSMTDEVDYLFISNLDGEDLLQIKDVNRFIRVLEKLIALKEQQ